ncbi:hypothetical protein evm_006225 [Chilo suppressalis]|nr:hypothetical protein evm_006225 [Chilo suppressalis]
MLWATVLLIALAVCQVPVKSTPVVSVDFIENVSRGESRIVSGWDARPGQHPHHVNLRMQSAAGALASCGGSIIHKHWVLTAAHCTALRVSVVIRAGMVYLHQAMVIEETREWHNYPTYVDEMVLIVQPNDISILRIRQPIAFSDFVKPIRIQPRADSYRNYDGKLMYASGHGRTWTGGSTPNALQWVYLRAISNQNCQRWFGTSLITKNSICTQYFNVTSQSTCHGDSGGPLVYEENGVPTLVGVTSFVAGEQSGGCHSGLPAGFIRPGPFHSWFTSVTGLDFDNLEEWATTTETPSTTTEPPTTTPELSTTTQLPSTEPPTTTPELSTTTQLPSTEPPSTTWLPTSTEPPSTTWLPTSTESPTTTPELPTAEVETTTWLPTTTTSPPTDKPDESEEKPEESEESGEKESEEEEPESDSDEDSDEDCDPELSQLLKKLQVEVKVKIKMDKTKHKFHHKHTIKHHRKSHHH